MFMSAAGVPDHFGPAPLRGTASLFGGGGTVGVARAAPPARPPAPARAGCGRWTPPARSRRSSPGRRRRGPTRGQGGGSPAQRPRREGGSGTAIGRGKQQEENEKKAASVYSPPPRAEQLDGRYAATQVPLSGNFGVIVWDGVRVPIGFPVPF